MLDLWLFQAGGSGCAGYDIKIVITQGAQHVYHVPKAERKLLSRGAGADLVDVPLDAAVQDEGDQQLLHVALVHIELLRHTRDADARVGLDQLQHHLRVRGALNHAPRRIKPYPNPKTLNPTLLQAGRRSRKCSAKPITAATGSPVAETVASR